MLSSRDNSQAVKFMRHDDVRQLRLRDNDNANSHGCGTTPVKDVWSSLEPR